MSVYVQHGYGKSDYIESTIANGNARGVILSARDESPQAMRALCDKLVEEGGRGFTVLLDPQFFAFVIPEGRIRNLSKYRYYPGLLSRSTFTDPADLRRFSTAALVYQSRLPLSRYVSPAIALEGFNDAWSQVYLTMARESIRWKEARSDDARPLVLSLVLNEAALMDAQAVDEFLDLITPWQVAGFYIVVACRQSGYPATLEATALGNLLYLIYGLSILNGFEIYCGYTDLVGILHTAAGAKAIASGWYGSLRQFAITSFMPSLGGGRARPRLTSRSLLNPILINPELTSVRGTNLYSEVLGDSEYIAEMLRKNPANVEWPASRAFLHHFEVLSTLVTEIESLEDTDDRLDRAEAMIDDALSTYAALRSKGVIFESRPANLQVWRNGLHYFRQRMK